MLHSVLGQFDDDDNELDPVRLLRHSRASLQTALLTFTTPKHVLAREQACYPALTHLRLRAGSVPHRAALATAFPHLRSLYASICVGMHRQPDTESEGEGASWPALDSVTAPLAALDSLDLRCPVDHLHVLHFAMDRPDVDLARLNTVVAKTRPRHLKLIFTMGRNQVRVPFVFDSPQARLERLDLSFRSYGGGFSWLFEVRLHSWRCCQCTPDLSHSSSRR